MKRKKSGIALVWVLVLLTSILIVGSAVLYYAVNSQKTNMNIYNEANANAILKSAISFGENNIIDNSKEYKNLNVGTVKSLEYDELGNKSNVIIEKLQDDTYEIKSNTVYKNKEYNLYGTIALTYKSDEIIKEVNKFIKNDSALTAFNGNVTFEGESGFFTIDTKFNFNNSTSNIYEANGNDENYIINQASQGLNSYDINVNNINSLYGEVPKIKGLKLAFAKGNLNLNQGTKPSITFHGVNWSKNNLDYYEENLNPNEVMLFGVDGQISKIQVNQLGKVNLKNYTGMLVKLTNGYVLINNGDITIEGNWFTKLLYEFSSVKKSMFIYSTGEITLNSAPMYLKNSSFISNEGINFDYSSFYNSGYFQVDGELNNILFKIMESQ